MKELQITVSGPAASGKSTMMLLLEEFLKEKGFNIELQLENELLDYGTEERFRRTMQLNKNEREKNIKDFTKITLKSMQMKRGSYK
jgi:nucleoside-triphosphatase THEP1